jgi:hypothetical protein
MGKIMGHAFEVPVSRTQFTVWRKEARPGKTGQNITKSRNSRTTRPATTGCDLNRLKKNGPVKANDGLFPFWEKFVPNSENKINTLFCYGYTMTMKNS